jgi:hypothetical protein
VRPPIPRIERKIQFEHVNARLAQESPLPVLRVLPNQACDFSFRNLASNCFYDGFAVFYFSLPLG